MEIGIELKWGHSTSRGEGPLGLFPCFSHFHQRIDVAMMLLGHPLRSFESGLLTQKSSSISLPLPSTQTDRPTDRA